MFPHDRSRPSVSFRVRVPFSKSSIPQAIAAPQLIVSMPRRLQSSLALITPARFRFMIIVPKVPQVSYSGPGPSSV